MLHSGPIAAKSLAGNRLRSHKVHLVGVAGPTQSAILWVKAQNDVKQPLNLEHMTIHFGTSGWRAVMGDDFTFAAVCRVTEAICLEFRSDSSIATSRLVDRVAKIRGLPVYETPVGFKFIGELINEDKITLGGEESAGLSIKGHYSEKDGFLACLLAAEAVAARGTSLTEQLDELYARTGRLESGRIGLRLAPELMPILKEKLNKSPVGLPGEQSNRLTELTV